jgi:hypothetical protein
MMVIDRLAVRIGGDAEVSTACVERGEHVRAFCVIFPLAIYGDAVCARADLLGFVGGSYMTERIKRGMTVSGILGGCADTWVECPPSVALYRQESRSWKW